MPQPDASDLHVDRQLTNISIAYQNNLYIEPLICPLVPVTRQTDLIANFDQSHWFRDMAELRAPGTRARQGGFTVGREPYHCPRYSFAFPIPDEVRDNTDDPFNMDRDGTEFATDKILLKREVLCQEALFRSGVWATDLVGGASGGGGDFTYFNDYANSDPLNVMAEYMDAMERRIAREPNIWVMGKEAWVKLKWHPRLIEPIKYTQRGQLTPDLMASLFEVPRIVIGRAIRTVDQEGTAEASVTYTRIWGNDLLMLYRPDAPSLMRPSACYALTWARVPNSAQYIRRIRREEEETDIIEANTYIKHHITATRAGTFLQNIVS